MGNWPSKSHMHREHFINPPIRFYMLQYHEIIMYSTFKGIINDYTQFEPDFI